MGDIQRTIEAMQEWERCPDGTVMRSSNSDAPWIKGRDDVYAWYTTAKYTFEYQDGWRKHEGDKCPVDGDTRVEVLLISGRSLSCAAKAFLWWADGSDDDVTHYRIIEEAKRDKVVWHKGSGGTYYPSNEGSEDCLYRDNNSQYTRVEVDLSGDSDD